LTKNDPLAIEKTMIGTHVRRLRGAPAILAHSRLLQDFAATTGQYAEMHGLQYKLEHEFARRKTPSLLCIVAGQGVTAPLTLDSLLGCVLLFEYRVASWNTGFFATGDSTGLGTVVAPPEIRAHVAALASCEVLNQGRMVLMCFRNGLGGGNLTNPAFPHRQQGLWAAQVREVRDRLRLGPTYDLTLSTLGKRTRTHMRYYRRHLQEQTGCIFIPDAASHIAESQLASLNTSSLKPLSQRAFDLQFNSTARLPGGFVSGLRSADDRWLCLAGGWRQGNTSMIEWQANAAGIGRISLSTAFRAFLIEHEISRGAEQLCFHGGTEHSIGHAFVQDHAVDLIVRRRGPMVSLIPRLIPYFAQRDPNLANRGNLLINALRTHRIHWAPLADAAATSTIGTYS
jgi:hypothetical protein